MVLYTKDEGLKQVLLQAVEQYENQKEEDAQSTLIRRRELLMMARWIRQG